ncbi:unnamed protein product, partial [Amoebophrya sp. A120]|eukprot:GSA120T00018085001.1
MPIVGQTASGCELMAAGCTTNAAEVATWQGRNIAECDVLAGTASGSSVCRPLLNTDYGGGATTTTSGKTWQECVRLCAQNPSCKHLVHRPDGGVAGTAKLTDGTTGDCNIKTEDMPDSSQAQNTGLNSLDMTALCREDVLSTYDSSDPAALLPLNGLPVGTTGSFVPPELLRASMSPYYRGSDWVDPAATSNPATCAVDNPCDSTPASCPVDFPAKCGAERVLTRPEGITTAVGEQADGYCFHNGGTNNWWAVEFQDRVPRDIAGFTLFQLDDGSRGQSIQNAKIYLNDSGIPEAALRTPGLVKTTGTWVPINKRVWKIRIGDSSGNTANNALMFCGFWLYQRGDAPTLTRISSSGGTSAAA